MVEVGDNGSRDQKYRNLMITFRPRDNISALLKQLEQMWDEDVVYLNERAAIFRQCKLQCKLQMKLQS